MCNSSALQCLNLTQEECIAVALTVGITDLVLSIVFISFLLCLILVLKSKAWNSPVKRLTLVLTTCFDLSEFMHASMKLYNGFLPGVWYEVFNILASFAIVAILLYWAVILLSLLFQILATIVPGNWKHRPKPRLLLLLEVIIHILIPVLSLSFGIAVRFSFRTIYITHG